MQGAGNQQERLDSYIAGYVDGEGCFAISVQHNASCRTRLQLVPEFHVSQNDDRAEVLGLIRERLGCGYIKRNGRRDRALVFVVRRREDLLERVIPFFEQNPIRSAKHTEFQAFAAIVRAMAAGQHLSDAGFRELLGLATAMNGGGRFRQKRWMEINYPESPETTRQTGEILKI